MTSDRDPEELFRSARPFLWGDDGPVDLDRDPVAAAILKRVLAGAAVVSLDEARERHRRRRWWLSGIIAGTVVVGGGAAAAVHFLRQEPNDLRSLSCWSAAQAPLPPEQVALQFDTPDPVAICRKAWVDGDFTSKEVPENLTACVSGPGIVVVIPGADASACRAIGLAAYNGKRDPHLDDIRLAEEELGDALNSTTCVPVEQAKPIARAILAKHDLADWKIETPDPFTDDKPCTITALIADTSTLYLAPASKTP